MLDLERFDLDQLCMAMEDHSSEASWRVDARTGEVRYHHPDIDDADALDDEALVRVDPVESRDAYRDMEAFIATVRDRRAAELLQRAIEGRGAFRRFKDTLYEFPDLRARWHDFHDARMRRRALRWLADAGLISDETAEREAGRHPDPLTLVEVTELEALVAAVADDLRRLYGDRLEKVLVFGSYARGEASEESDVDLLVVLAELESPWDELRRMDDLLWRHTDRTGVTVSAIPVSASEFRRPTTPVLIRAKAEALPVA